MILSNIYDNQYAEMKVFPSLLTQDDQDRIWVYLIKECAAIDLARHKMLRTYAREE